MDIRGAEIFKSGTWNGLTFSDEDLDGIVQSFDAMKLAGRVPLKFGHNEEQPFTDGKPALGWVSKLWRDGNRLLADFAAIPKIVYDAIKGELYKFVSVELLQEAEREGQTHPWVLSAVALLGADVPAVAGLKDLSTLAMSKTSGLKWRQSVTFTADRESIHSKTGDRKQMAGENDAAELAELRAKFTKMEAENTRLAGEAERERQERLKEKADGVKATIEAKFKTAIEARALNPASRERYFKWFVPAEVERLAAMDLTDVDKFIEENKVSMSKPTGGGSASGTDDEEGKNADVIVVQRTRKFMIERNERDYSRAVLAVLREDPDLAEQYRSLPDRLYK